MISQQGDLEPNSYQAPAQMAHRGLLWSTAVTLGLRVVGTAAGFIFSILVTRSLGITAAGTFFLVISILNILSVLSRFGADTVAARQAAIAHSEGREARLRGVATLSIGITFLAGTVLGTALWTLAPILGQEVFVDEALTPLLKLSAVAIFPIAAQKVLSDLLLVTNDVFASQILQMLLPPVANFLLFWLMVDAFGIDGGLSAVVIAAYIVLAISVACWWRKPEHRVIATDWPELRDFVRSCWVLVGVSAAGLGISGVSAVFLGVFGSKEDVATFTVAWRVAMLASFVTLAVQNATLRKFSVQFNKGDRETLKTQVKLATRLSAVLCALLLIPCIAFPDWIMGIFGDGFEGGARALVILCGGQLLAGALGPVTALLLMSGSERIVRDCTIIAAVANVVLHAVVVPVWGVTGAAVVVSIAFVASTLAQVFVVRGKLGFWSIG